MNKSIQSALEHYQSGNLRQAEDICLEILKTQPDNVNILNLLGMIYYRLQEHGSAIQYLTKALQNNPANVTILYNLGNVYKDLKKPDEAIIHYQKAVEINPNFYEAYNNLGTVLQEKGKPDDAVACYRRALELNPHLVDAYYNLGTVLRDKGQPDDARTCYQQAIQLDPNILDAYFGISEISQMEGRRYAVEKSFLSEQWSLETLSIQVDNEKKLLYIVIPKAGSTAIKYEFIWKNLFGNIVPPEIAQKRNAILGYHFTKSLEPYKDYFKFTVVRDPYTRFLSAFFHVIHKGYRKDYNFEIIRSLGIEDWPDEIVNDPNEFLHSVTKEILNRNPHTALQTYLLPRDLKELDYIGQLENKEELGSTLSQMLNVDIRFDLQHFKGPVRDYYSVNINRKRFNQLFMEDYETLKRFYKPLTG